MNKFYFSLVIFIFITISLQAQNPIAPPGIYFADPAAHVWKDGKIYIYGSVDENPDYYCSKRFHVISSSDMKNWKVAENVFTSVGPNDQVSYHDDFLYASDCMYKNGTYYLYYASPSKDKTEGVAISSSPVGPFKNGQPMDLDGLNQIDPNVFVDDDGQAYYIWGQFSAKVAKLNSDMITIDKSTIVDSVVTEKDHYFHEGSFMIKRNGIYYFIYADISRADMPTAIGYSTSDSPFGPFTYGGVIVDNDHCDPGNWNNHGSLLEFNNQWYVFYHRSTHGSNTTRKMCVEPISFNGDGSIDEVEMTSNGAQPPLNALEKLQAEWSCLLYGNCRIEMIDADEEKISGIKNNDRSVIKYVDFDKDIIKVKVRVKPGKKKGKIHLFLDQPWYHKIAEIDVPSLYENKNEWTVLESNVEGAEGIRALQMLYTGEGESLFSVDWIQFSK